MKKTLYENLYEYLKEKFEWWERDVLNEDIEEFADHFAQLLDDDDNKDNKNFKIYKYQPIGQYAFHNIISKQIHLTENGKLNDLFEGVLKKNYSALNYSEKNIFEELAYVSCFAISPDNVLMWSHYADSFKGICIEYDLNLLGSKNEYLKHLFPVIYSNDIEIEQDIPKICKEACELKKDILENNEHDEQGHLSNVLPMFLVKRTEWKYEKEIRLIYTAKQLYDINDETLYTQNIPFDCISAIYFGARVDWNTKNDFIKLINFLNSESSRKIEIKEMPLPNSD